jgi:intein/homing endonuclease
MAENKLTVWQRLGKVFGPTSTLDQQSPVFKFDKKQLLKTTDKNEFEREKLEAQQTMYIGKQWQKVESNLYQQAVYYEPTRMASYYDYEAMEYSIHGDTKIATPDGFMTIKELSDKGRDYEFITYAYDHNLKKVVPAIARNAHYTRDEMAYKITFDDGSHIIATYGHRFLKRDGVFCEVENLKPGDSMMPFYRKSFYNNQNYHWVYTCNSNEGHHGWISEHNLIAEWYYKRKINEDEEVHHKDFNGKNNKPENLQIMNISEHRAYHARLNNEKLWANPEYRQKMSEVARRTGKYSWEGKRAKENNPAYIKLSFDLIVEKAREHRTLMETATSLGVSFRKIQNELRFNGFKNWFDFLDVYGIDKSNSDTYGEKNNNFKKIAWDLLIEIARQENSITNTAKRLNVSRNKILKTIKEGGFNNWITFLESYGIEKSKHHHPKNEEPVINHKIVSIEPYGVVPVYDLTVPGYKNFATDTIFSHNTPEISAALDIYSEESTTPDQDGHILKVYSESKRIKQVLVDLFVNRLDINTNLPMWTRNTCKFGDNFTYLKLDPEKGVVGCQQLPNIQIERLEKGMRFQPDKYSQEMENDALKFVWKEKNMEFNTWEIAHFRILGDDRKLPYGTSMLEKARRIWKQLLLSEDAMMIYRVSRAPERRVFKVFVGNMDDKDVDSYVQRVANKFKRDQIADPKTGNVDMRYNQLAVDQDYFIPVRDPSQTNPIETLPGGTNLAEIADIEYIQKKLVTALRIPKAYLGFEEAVGNGQNLSLLDIRFARTINKIQKSMLAELNKIAIIHLFLLGFEDELTNFTLGLHNPSKQSELLSLELWKEKIELYKNAVAEIANSVAPTSASWAKKNILGFSDEEIRLDLQQQRIERAVAAELAKTPEVITKTGLFDNIDQLYGKKPGEPAGEAPEGGEESGGMPPMGGGSELGGPPPPPGPEPGGEVGVTPESTKKNDLNLILEDNLYYGKTSLDLSKGRLTINEIDDKLKDLLDK